MDKYSILIPVHNELNSINILLDSLVPFSTNGHEIIIIDDGSTDGSNQLLQKSSIIKLITIDRNQGKGHALKEGLRTAVNNRIIVYDGDLELNPSDITNLMILEKDNKIRFVMGYRFKSLNPLKSNFDWGNFMFTTFFNILFKTCHKDILCCAKAFYVNDIKMYNIVSNQFDIDIELSSILTIQNKNRTISQIPLNYTRRSIQEGKKLKISDGWSILSRIIKMLKYF